jgi:hypothetical protein
MLNLKYFGELDTDFIQASPNNGSWNVVRGIYAIDVLRTVIVTAKQTRDDFDDILLRHAEKVGVKVFEETRALSINFANNTPKGRPVAAKWQNQIDKNVSATISFDYLIDATGKEGIMARKYLNHRKTNMGLRNVACWGYWKGTGAYGVGTSRENAPWFEALTGIFSSEP